MKKGIDWGKDMKKSTGAGKAILLVFGGILAAGTALTYLTDRIFTAVKGEEEKKEEVKEDKEDGE